MRGEERPSRSTPRPPSKPRTPAKPARKPAPDAARQRRRRVVLAILGGLMGLIIVAAIAQPALLNGLPFVSRSGGPQFITDEDAPLAPFFAPEVLRWRSRLEKWAKQYDVNPNVIAMVIQIESCGSPDVISPAGALGLMQVMPFHFEYGENMLNPDVNVRNGMDVFYECLKEWANWDLGVALACYNGGPSVATRDRSAWPQETQAYYRWATGIWSDVRAGKDRSATLDQWLDAGGQGLCSLASESPVSSSGG